MPPRLRTKILVRRTNIEVTRVFGWDVIDVRRAVKILPNAVADEDGDDAEAQLPGVLENSGADAAEMPARSASFDSDIEAIFSHLPERNGD